MKLLHIDASITGDHSVSRQVSAAIVQRLRQAAPGLTLVRRDLVAAPLPHLTLAHMPGAPAVDGLAAEQIDSNAVIDEFLTAEVVVIGAPMYNFTLPSQLKAWIDRVLVAGRTFRYTASGPEGLARGKRVIVALSRGGFYGPGTPAAAVEHVESYLRAVFGLMGVTDPEFVVAEGVQISPDHRQQALTGALKAVGEISTASAREPATA
jgi:FMN-dependent NADH-azoreductase